MFGDILKELRTDEKLTQEELAAKLEITRGALSKYETNDNEPDLSFLVKVSTYFGVSVDYMLGKTKISTQSDALYSLKNLTDSDSKKLSSILSTFEKNNKYIDVVYCLLEKIEKIK